MNDRISGRRVDLAERCRLRLELHSSRAFEAMIQGVDPETVRQIRVDRLRYFAEVEKSLVEVLRPVQTLIDSLGDQVQHLEHIEATSSPRSRALATIILANLAAIEVETWSPTTGGTTDGKAEEAEGGNGGNTDDGPRDDARGE
jgi:hypothetical protein